MWIQYALWIVFGLITLDALIGWIKSIFTGSFSLSDLAGFLQNGILYSVFPLTILNELTSKDPTGWIVNTLFYLAALGVAYTYVKAIIKRF